MISAYLRVSSLAQNVATQKAAIERAAAARGDVIVEWYSEKKSGKTIARPELDRVRDLARQGHLQKLYVYRLDRLARSGIRDMLTIIEDLRGHGCEGVSIADAFHLT